MNHDSIARSQNVPVLLLSNRREALDLLDSGFLIRNPHIRLFFLEEEKEWLLVGQISESMKRKIYINAGASADYI